MIDRLFCRRKPDVNMRPDPEEEALERYRSGVEQLRQGKIIPGAEGQKRTAMDTIVTAFLEDEISIIAGNRDNNGYSKGRAMLDLAVALDLFDETEVRQLMGYSPFGRIMLASCKKVH